METVEFDPFSGVGTPRGYRKPYELYTPQRSTRRTELAEIRKETHLKTLPIKRTEPVVRKLDCYSGSKRAFNAAQTQKLRAGQKVLDNAWMTQEKIHKWEYQRQVDTLQARIKLRDNDSLRRENKIRSTSKSETVQLTTGPLQRTKIPREVPNTYHDRTHIHYWG